MSETGWHQHDSGAIHRDDADCTWLGNPVPCEPPAEEPGLTDFLLARIAEDEDRWAVHVGIQERRLLDIGILPTPEDLGAHSRWPIECEARRRVVEEAEHLRLSLIGSGGVILRALALPYADHPDYDEAWRP